MTSPSQPHRSVALTFSTFILSLISSFLTWSFLGNPHAHLHIIKSATPVSCFIEWPMAGFPWFHWFYCIFCESLLWLLFCHSAQSSSPTCSIQIALFCFTSTSIHPLFCITLTRYLNSLTSGIWLLNIFMLPSDVQFRPKYSIRHFHVVKQCKDTSMIYW